ncbi:MAG TPA: hypothetical protein VGL58_03425 [Caulobacteraceae bacterium]|jgi:hypothetical protein
MRVFCRVNIPAHTGNVAIKDGTLPQLMEGFMAKIQPEAAYFGLEAGHRTMFVVFDLKDPSDIPVIFEPLFQGLDAEVHWQPVMDRADLAKGLAAAAGR